MSTQVYEKPSGVKIEVNDTEETRALAKELGWKKPRGRRPRVTDDDSGRSRPEGA